MIKKQIVFPAPDGGLNSVVSSALINDNQLALAENVEFISGKVRKRPGTAGAVTTLTSPSSLAPRKAYKYKMTDGTEKILVYERGTTTPFTRKIYQATGGTWTWDELDQHWGGGGNLVLTNTNKPKFMTVRGKCLISQGDNVIGLMYWDGAGEVYRTIGEGDEQYTASGRFGVYYKERLILANGYYFDNQNLNAPYWCPSRKPSAIFPCSLYDSNGDEVDPHQSAAWWETWKYYREISEDDGGEIVAMWVMKDAIYVGKTTGIWRVFFNDISKLYIDRVTNIPMESEGSLKMFPVMDGCIFRNSDHVYFFNGRDEPKPIDEPIKNYIDKIPNFDIGGEGDSDDVTLDTKDQWNNAMDGEPPVENIRVDDLGYIEIDTEAFDSYTQSSSDNEIDCGGVVNRKKIGFRFSPSDFCELTTVKLKMKRGAPDTGTFDVSVFSGMDTGLVEEELTTPITTDISTLSLTETVETFDFTSQYLELTKNYVYWVVVSWVNEPSPFFVSYLAGSWADYTNAEYVTRWEHFKDKKGYLYVAGEKYYTSGNYHTKDSGSGSLSFDIVPDIWGEFTASDTGEVERIVYKIRSNPDQGAGNWTGWETIQSGDTPTIACQKYVDFHIELTSSNGSHSSPVVQSVSVMGYKTTGEVTDRFMCSTIFNNKYHLSTNMNTDGVYRTFVLDKNGRWAIYPDQLIIDYFDYDFNKYLVTVDINAKIHKMYRGEESNEYNYDRSTKTPSGNTRYLMKIRTKKFDCGIPAYLKLMKKARISTGTVFSTNYLHGTMKYRLDNENWETVYFQDVNSIGDTAIKHTFPAGERGKYIQFQFETYYEDTNYGTPYYVKDIVLDFFIQRLELLSETQTTVLDDVGTMVE